MINYSIMKKLFLYTVLLVGLGSCHKELDAPLLSVSNSHPDTTSDIRTALANSPYHLFFQAYNLVKLDSSYAYYTIFAPTDSAMTAAGLTSAVINSLSVDSLYRLVAYQVGSNGYSDSTLKTQTLPLLIPSLRVDPYITIEQNSGGQLTGAALQQNLFVQEKDVLYINGEPVNNGESPLKARNGWIYPVDRVLTAPDSTVWSILTSKPELSMYIAAMRLVDSFYTASYYYYNTRDSITFSTVYWQTQNALTGPNVFYCTVFAPTNAAFAQAGFHTVDDLRQYITSVVPYTTDAIYKGAVYYVENSIPMDSVLKEQYLNTAGSNPLFYPDLLNPAINNGWQNSNQLITAGFAAWPGDPPYYTQFSNVGGTVHMQWSRNPAVPAAVLPATAPTFPAINGIVYEIDQLFYPHN